VDLRVGLDASAKRKMRYLWRESNHDSSVVQPVVWSLQTAQFRLPLTPMKNFYFAEFFISTEFGRKKGSCYCSIHRTGTGASKLCAWNPNGDTND
jgi:hypothetical protein